MGYFRYYRRAQLLPGVRVNLSKSGPSFTFGVRGAHVTAGRRGVTRTLGIPGSGVFYTSRGGRHTGVHSAHRHAGAAAGGGCLLALLALALPLAGRR